MENWIILPSWRQLVFILVWIVAWHLLVFLVGLRRPYSAYHSPDLDERNQQLGRMINTSKAAISDIRVWMKEKGVKAPIFNEPGSKKLCVGILSYKEGKVEETVGSLLTRLKWPLKDRIRITVFAEKDSSVEDILVVQTIPEPRFIRGSVPESALRSYHHSHVLKTLHFEKCEYGLVLEDAVPEREWAAKVLEIIEQSGDDPPWVVMRLMSEYGLVRFTIWKPNELLFLLSMAIILFLLAWGITYAVMFTLHSTKVVSDLVLIDFVQLAIPTITLLILSFFIGLVLLGRPNVPPLGTGILKIDTGRLAVANLYPRNRMIDYAMTLESSFQTAIYQNSLSTFKSHDKYYPRLVQTLERQQGMKFSITTMKPSLFQNINRPSLSQLDELKMSYDFPDGNVDVMFKGFEFLDINSKKYYSKS